MNYFKKKCEVLEWFYHWIEQGQSYDNAFSQVIYYLNREDDIDNIIIPVVIGERLSRNYKPISNDTALQIKNAVIHFDEIHKETLDFSKDDIEAFCSDVKEARSLIDYLYNNK